MKGKHEGERQMGIGIHVHLDGHCGFSRCQPVPVWIRTPQKPGVAETDLHRERRTFDRSPRTEHEGIAQSSNTG